MGEPTLGLFGPIDGGDYVVDDTVKGLTRRVGVDVVELDRVRLIPGSVGPFSSGTSPLFSVYFH